MCFLTLRTIEEKFYYIFSGFITVFSETYWGQTIFFLQKVIKIVLKIQKMFFLNMAAQKFWIGPPSIPFSSSPVLVSSLELTLYTGQSNCPYTKSTNVSIIIVFIFLVTLIFQVKPSSIWRQLLSCFGTLFTSCLNKLSISTDPLLRKLNPSCIYILCILSLLHQ